MHDFEDLKIVTREEAEIIYHALHMYLFSDKIYKKLPKKELLVINDLYQEFKRFLQDDSCRCCGS